MGPVWRGGRSGEADRLASCYARALALAEEFEARSILPLSLSYDHRVIDGADAARFLRWVCDSLQQPLTLLLD